MKTATARRAHWSCALVRLKACNEAVEWARTKPDYATAWRACERGDWMLWLLERTGADAERLRRLAYRFADQAVREDACAALRAAAGAPGMLAEHVATLCRHADILAALPIIDSSDAAGAASYAAWAASAAARAASDAAWAASAAAGAASYAAGAARSKEQAAAIRAEFPEQGDPYYLADRAEPNP